MRSFDEGLFRSRVNTALERVRTILDNTRTPQYAADVSHEYSDKFLLAEYLANSAISGHLNCLHAIGVNEKLLAEMKIWAKTRSVTLRLKVEETCKFLRKTVREVESETKHVTTTTLFGTKKDFTVTKITEWFWQFDSKWELVAFTGTDTEHPLVLQARAATLELKTTVESTPKSASVVRPSIDVNITWLLQHLEAEGNKPTFSINRKTKKCRTPRRNLEIEDALNFMRNFYNWATQVHSFFSNTLFPVQVDHGLDLSSVRNETTIFVPVLPLFEKRQEITPYLLGDKTPTINDDSVLPDIYSGSFLGEQARSMAERFKDLASIFPANEKIITVTEAKLLVVLLHAKRICESFSESVDYIEDMLHKQLVAAIGKVVTPVDFTNYLNFHNRKLYKPAYQPRAFCYAIRRPDHYPEGTLSIEAQLDDGGVANPISTIVSHAPARAPMYFSINASTKVAFTGDRYLHGYVAHQFDSYSGTELSLVARARQFSSFILLVGRIASAELFEPKYGIILQNKDELKIPLMLNTIPTPKEFKDAIESLSPEQQRFCKAFRSMQLESTLFGVCVIQIKPQLEKLLKLPDDSLTKEIQLAQDLQQLFIKYQIPSDLISYDGEANESVSTKVATVKGYVANMHAMVEQSKQTSLADAKEEQQYRLAQASHDYPTSTTTVLMSVKSSMPSPCCTYSFYRNTYTNIYTNNTYTHTYTQ
jgi:hypothetical protein